MNEILFAVTLLVASPEANQKIEMCWVRANEMQEEGISQESIQAYVTKCLGDVLRRLPVEPHDKPEREWAA